MRIDKEKNPADASHLLGVMFSTVIPLIYVPITNEQVL